MGVKAEDFPTLRPKSIAFTRRHYVDVGTLLKTSFNLTICTANFRILLVAMVMVVIDVFRLLSLYTSVIFYGHVEVDRTSCLLLCERLKNKSEQQPLLNAGS